MTVQALLKRFDKVKSLKNSNWYSHMRECYEYAAPQRETFFDYSPGEKKNTTIYDDTAVIALETFASRLQSYMIPPYQRWALIGLGSRVPDEVGEQPIQFDGQDMTVNEALELTTDIVFDYIHRSNFDTQMYPALLDLGISTGNITVEYDAKQDKLQFNCIPMPQMYLEPGPDGSIDNHYREWDVELGHVQRMFPDAKLSDELSRQIEKSPQKKQVFIEACLYDGEMYRYVVIDKVRKKFLIDREDESTPFISFRSSVAPGETYGRGRIMSVLPSIKTLNLVAEYEMTSGAIAASGVFTGVTDGQFNPYNIEIAPGVIIPVQSNDNRNPSIRPLDVNFNFQFTQIQKQELQNNINTVLFANPIGSMDDPTKTATEITMRKQMDLQQSGGFFSRLFSEFIDKVLERVVYLLSNEGIIPRIEIDGRNYQIKHTSPLALAMDLEDVQNLDEVMQRLMSYDPQGSLVAAGIKVEDIPSYVAKKVGLDPELVRTKAEIEEKAQQAMQMQQQQMQMQQGGQQEVIDG